MQPSPPPQAPQYPIPPPGAGPPPYYLPPPMPPRKSRTALIVVIVVVIILVVGLSGAVYVLTSHTVHVTAENISITGPRTAGARRPGAGRPSREAPPSPRRGPSATTPPHSTRLRARSKASRSERRDSPSLQRTSLSRCLMGGRRRSRFESWPRTATTPAPFPSSSR